MKTVVFFIGSLQLGGTEAKLARNFLPLLKANGKVNPKMLLLQERGEFLETVPAEIERISLNETSQTNLLSIIPKFGNALQKFNIEKSLKQWEDIILGIQTGA